MCVREHMTLVPTLWVLRSRPNQKQFAAAPWIPRATMLLRILCAPAHEMCTDVCLQCLAWIMVALPCKCASMLLSILCAWVHLMFVPTYVVTRVSGLGQIKSKLQVHHVLYVEAHVNKTWTVQRDYVVEYANSVCTDIVRVRVLQVSTLLKAICSAP